MTTPRAAATSTRGATSAPSPDAVGEDPGPLIEEFDSTWRSAKEITAAEAFQPAMPLRKRERRRVRWTAVLAVLVLAVLGFAGYKFVSGVGPDPARGRGQPASLPRRAASTEPAGQRRGVQGSSAPASADPAVLGRLLAALPRRPRSRSRRWPRPA